MSSRGLENSGGPLHIPIFKKEQEIYDLVTKELESDNPRLSREILLEYKEYFEDLGVILYSPLTPSIMRKIYDLE